MAIFPTSLKSYAAFFYVHWTPPKTHYYVLLCKRLNYSLQMCQIWPIMTQDDWLLLRMTYRQPDMWKIGPSSVESVWETNHQTLIGSGFYLLWWKYAKIWKVSFSIWHSRYGRNSVLWQHMGIFLKWEPPIKCRYHHYYD